MKSIEIVRKGMIFIWDWLYILSYYCRFGGYGCFICKFKIDWVVIGWGRKIFNFWLIIMDLFGCIFIKVLVVIFKLNVCIGSKMNVKYVKKRNYFLFKV